MKSLFVICSRVLLVALLTGMSMAARNPVPAVDQPLIPASVQPGSKGFLLTVNGSGFASGAVVKWNGSSRVTFVNSSHQVQAEIKASDVAKAGTATVTVVNPKPGGGASNVVYLPIRKPARSIGFGVDTRLTSKPGPGLVTTGDFNGDGIVDFAIAVGGIPGSVFVYLGKGDGTFRAPIESPGLVFLGQLQMLAVDVNNDGKLDLLVVDNLTNGWFVDVLLGDGTGSFGASPAVGFDLELFGIAAGDINGDGNLDLVVAGSPDYRHGTTTVFLGNGDGTFTQGSTLEDGGYGIPVLADFNGDGNLDIACASFIPNNDSLVVWLGNGDGTFGTATSYSTNYFFSAVAAADINSDGKLDMVTNGADVFLGNGDGTFSSGASIPLSPYYAPIAVGDFNGDGKLDLGVATVLCQSCNTRQVTVLLGNGKGNFHSLLQFPLDMRFAGFGAADFNNDGQLDYVISSSSGPNVFLQGTAVVKPANLDFGTIKVGSHSRPQSATLSNIGSSALKIRSISIGGDPTDFSETNHCGKSVPPHGSCKITVTFSPQQGGMFAASVDIKYGGGSLLQVTLSGTGTVVTKTVSLTPSKMTFATQLVGTKSSAQTATLTNTGTQAVNISKIQATAPFGKSHNCPSRLDPGNSCQIEVTFLPTQKGDAQGTLEVTDDAQGSPQKIALAGTGTVVKVAPTSVNFGDQKVGTKSPVVPIKLTNVGTVALAVSKIAIAGKDPGDFSESNDCGNSVPAGGSCTIKVRFAPQKKGQRSADVSITDDGGGSPQQVGLFGNGT